jgi:hypothetical protein
MKVGEFAYTDFLGLPMLVWGGMATLALLFLTFLIGYMNHRGNHTIPFKYHKPVAMLTVCMGIIHGLIGMLASLGY